MNATPKNITALLPHEIFVFGSNLAGRHGAGAAKQAVKFGARYGAGTGWSGGQTYAIPTKGHNLQILPLDEIQQHVDNLLLAVRHHPELHFLITAIGCGLAGYKPEQIAPMFREFLNFPNVSLPQEFLDILIQ